MGVQLDVSPRIPAQTPIFIESDRLDSRDFVIRNCHFHDAKNRGILVRGGRGLIENNWITGTTSSGIQLAAEAGSAAAEGPTIDDVIVRHNRIADTNRADFSFAPGTQKLPAAVMVYATNGRGYADPVNRHIRIEDNDISDVPWTGIFIASSDDASVAGNKLRRVNLENYGKTRYPAAGIYVMQSRHVHIGGNDAVDGVVADKATTSDVVVSNDR
jgi:hypothetical protein